MRWIVKLYSKGFGYVPKVIAERATDVTNQGSAYSELLEAVQCALGADLQPSTKAQRRFGASRDIYEAELDTVTDKGIQGQSIYVEFVRSAK